MGEDLAPVIVSVLVLLIPIIAILTNHQRKMAELLHRNINSPLPAAENSRLEAEVAMLKQALHQQTLALDSLTDEVKKLRGAGSVAERLNETR